KVDDDVDDVVTPGQVVTYTITLINTGDGAATGVDISDTIDSNTENLTNFTFNNCGGSYVDNSASPTVDITDLEIAVGVNCVITYDVDVKAGLLDGTLIDNQVTIGASDEGGTGATPSSDQLTVDNGPDLSTSTKTDDDLDNTVIPGQTV